MNTFDYKKEDKDLYVPKEMMIIEVPKMAYVMVEGEGNPNTSESYQEAISILYKLSYTIKMSKIKHQQPKGYYDFVVPPLEGLWAIDDEDFDEYKIEDKENFYWKAMIRLPDFVSKDYFEEVKREVTILKPHIDVSKAQYFVYDEGLCIQMMHKGSYDDEPISLQKMNQFMDERGFVCDISKTRFHHEIYLSNPKRTKTENLKTVIRLPIQKIR